MVQLYVYDDTGARYEVDLYKDEPIKLTLSIEEITDLPRVNSAFSQTFRVPATQNNSKVFKWWYEVNTVDFDITKRVVAEIHSDGLFYKSGHIRIQAAYVNEETSQVDLELVFFGETRDFASQIGEITLDKLNLAYLNHNLDLTNVQNSWAGTLHNGDIRYALADRGYTYDDAGVVLEDSEIADKSHHTYSFQKSAHPLNLTQFTPMIRVKAIIDAIFEQTEYSYSSDSFFNSSLFEDLYTDGIPDASSTTTELSGLMEAQSVGQQKARNEEVNPVLFTNEIEDIGGNYANQTGRYHVPADGTYAMEASLPLLLRRNILHPSTTYEVKIMRRNVGGDIQLATSGLLTTPIGFTTYPDTVTVNFNGTLTQDVDYREYVYVKVEFGSPLNHAVDEFSRFEVTSAPTTMAISKFMKYDVKCVDFLKSIITKFKLIMAPNPDNEFEFVIKPWKDYIASGDRVDWTYKLDVSKDVQLSPIFFEQTQLIDFTDKEDEDLKNKPFQEDNARVYGALQFDSQNDLLKETKTIDTIFAPTPVDIVIGFDAASEFVIPYFAKQGTEEADHGYLQQLPMKIKPRLLFWNGLAAQGTSEDWYYTDGTTTVHNTTNYPRFTPYSVFPTTSSTINLNWFRETPYFTGPNDGKSVYEEYWNQYVQELYSNDARKLTAYFNLDSQDLRTLSFDDIIFIENAYYRILKVYNAPLAEISTVKVDLVKILETVTYANGGDPSPGGGGIDDVVVTGGGGSPVGGGTSRVYTIQTCVNPGDPEYASYTSVNPLTAGQSVKTSADGGAECWEIINVTTNTATATVLSVYTDCTECQSE